MILFPLITICLILFGVYQQKFLEKKESQMTGVERTEIDIYRKKYFWKMFFIGIFLVFITCIIGAAVSPEFTFFFISNYL